MTSYKVHQGQHSSRLAWAGLILFDGYLFLPSFHTAASSSPLPIIIATPKNTSTLLYQTSLYASISHIQRHNPYNSSDCRSLAVTADAQDHAYPAGLPVLVPRPIYIFINKSLLTFRHSRRDRIYM